MNSFQKDIDTLLSENLTDYRNQFPGVDTSQGSLVYIKSAVLAAALWGAYKHQEYTARQIHPDTADTANLEHHAWERGITRRTLETDAELLSRLLSVMRRPPAGGNRYDYETWALEVDGVKSAWCIPLAQGPGTVDVLILASGEIETPSTELLAAVLAHIDDVRPVTASIVRVLAPTQVAQDVTLSVSGSGVSRTAISADITAYMSGLEPGEALTLSRLTALAMAGVGVTDVTISVPAETVTVAGDEMIRPGVIDVS